MKRMKETPVIKVGIMSGDEIRFELTGHFSDQDHRQFRPGKYKAMAVDEKMMLEMEGNTVILGNHFFLSPADYNVAVFRLLDVTIGLGFHWQRREEQLFRGALNLMSSASGITVINVLPVEDYLVSVISSEMSATSSVEMLKAHAVISRGWLMAQIEKGKELRGQHLHYQSVFFSDEELTRWYDREDHAHFDVCADDHCQRYQGITRASTPVVEDAVRETRGEILTHEGNICDTRFSKCCGGFTELFENAWEPVHHQYLQSIYDNPEMLPEAAIDLTIEESARAWIFSDPPAFCNTTDKKILSQVLNDYDQTTRDFYRWKVTYTREELSELMKSKTGIDFGIIHDLIPVERGVSGRLIRLKVVGSMKSMVIGKELEIRKALSQTHLYSSAFVVEKVETNDHCIFTLHGAGWGHGVGLCQIGAAVMGARGYSYRDILRHYFRGAELERRY